MGWCNKLGVCGSTPPRPPLRTKLRFVLVWPTLPTAQLRCLREGYRDRLRVSASSNINSHSTALQTCVITPIVSGAGAPSCFAFPPPCERACGTPGARCTLGPDANAVFRNVECIRTFGITSKCPAFRIRCFFGCLRVAMANDPITKITVPRRMGQGASSEKAGRVLTLVVRHTVQGSFHLKVGRLLASGSADADPSCPKTDVTPKPRNAASPASTAPSPANVTIALAPLIGAGQRG